MKPDEATVQAPIATSEIHLEMTKADVRALFGPPTEWGGTSRRFPEPSI
jgi:hypothetical protein